MMNVTTLAGQIVAGERDDELEALVDAIRTRRQYLQEIKRAERRSSVHVGDRVRLTDIRPQYLKGLTGQLIEMPPQGRAVVRLDQPFRAANYVRPDGTIHVLASSVEPVR